MAKNQLHENCKFLVSLLKKDNVSWGKEIKIAKGLLGLYPEIEFWENLYLDTYPTSLSIFLIDSGKKFLKKEHEAYLLLQETKPVKLEKEPLIKVETHPVKEKPKTLQQFADAKD